MPELPEVETVARLLRPKLVGRVFRGGEVLWARTIESSGPDEFLAALRGASCTRVWRRAKFVVVDLERRGKQAGHLVCHLRMTGRLHVEAPGYDSGSHLRVRLELDDRKHLFFIDVRKFGRMWFVREQRELFGELGPEPLEDAFDVDRFHAALRARKRQLKPLLLDQSFVAGLGNIYVDESLFRAGLHPLANSARLDRAAAKRLHTAIRSILSAAIAREGSSFDTFYRTPEGKPGGFQDEFQVYDREGEPCTRCGAAIVKTVVGQRGTHFCRTCQPRALKRGANARAARST
ncbi:MAG: bifunctional DNA-formamidopyrimidine glycosylase/DNA-(apurinic or apyrimidinic site) lyase [Planctomycetes bacterium]|nr:bifunctional DNA-formamidopyrimidine glycosylase/DNA-(apurinic or apyrimidinic site) lyase [Planctomycetota bacterium]